MKKRDLVYLLLPFGLFIMLILLWLRELEDGFQYWMVIREERKLRKEYEKEETISPV